MTELGELTAIANERFDHYLDRLGGSTPRHRVEFSRRITTSWALIYYRRALVRLSPYLFLLDPHELKHGSHWRELDATLRHEAAHAAHYARTGETGHGPGFHALLQELGVRANGCCDLGPENAAFRHVYACPACSVTWPRRQALSGNWSCGHCAPGRYDPAYQLVRVSSMDPWSRLSQRTEWLGVALEEARGPAPVTTPPILSAMAAAAVLP